MSTIFEKVYTYGSMNAENILIQMVDDHDISMIEQEISYIRELAPEKNFFLIAVKVNNWNQDLSPWCAPPVFGKEGFGEGAADTLDQILKELQTDDLARKIYIGGYSLAGLFALWAVYQTDVFSGAAAASPSIWFPGFTDYMKTHPIRTKSVYLSLGDKEEKTRNPVMAQVGNAIRDGYEWLKSRGCDCILEWNEGNHFKDPDLRTAKAFAWLLNSQDKDTLQILEPVFSVCKVKDYSQVDLDYPYCFTGSTDEEKSLVCPVEIVPDNTTARDDGWKCFRICGELDFSLIGILARISKILAENEIGIFAVSTYNTDYIFTKEKNFKKALNVLSSAGYQLIENKNWDYLKVKIFKQKVLQSNDL